MGILDSKSRVIDAIVTLEGRRQVAQGKLRIAGATFTDAGVHYMADAASGSIDASTRFYFEACDLPQDQIVFESDDSGQLVPFRSAGEHQLRAGQVLTYGAVSGAQVPSEQMRVLSGTGLEQAASDVLDSSLTSFRRQMILSTRDRLFEDDGFAVGPESVTFVMDDHGPIDDPESFNVDPDALEGLFQDPRLSHLPNFRFLPPVNAGQETGPGSMLGSYRPWGDPRPLTYESLRRELDTVEAKGGCRTLSFDPTTRTNRVVGQLFERTSTGLRKLDVIDFGVHATGRPSSPTAHVFFAGRLVEDSAGVHTFVHVFTLVFE
jgi:hypothetical protein